VPNRNGMTTDHGLWPGDGIGHGGQPDVQARACMANCAPNAPPGAVLPMAARNAHGHSMGIAERLDRCAVRRRCDPDRLDFPPSRGAGTDRLWTNSAGSASWASSRDHLGFPSVQRLQRQVADF
jgi:hypothetical protein